MRAFSTASFCVASLLVALLFVAHVHANDASDPVLHDVRRDTEDDAGGDGAGVDAGKDPVDNAGGADTDAGDTKPNNDGDGDAADDGTSGAGQGDGVNDPVPLNNTDSNGTSGTTVGKSMAPPPIDSDQLAGLLVAGILFVIFLSGFLCLWNIQTPQAFTTLDGSDMSKKNQ